VFASGFHVTGKVNSQRGYDKNSNNNENNIMAEGKR
jgi:hypothetical protein